MKAIQFIGTKGLTELDRKIRFDKHGMVEEVDPMRGSLDNN